MGLHFRSCVVQTLLNPAGTLGSVGDTPVPENRCSQSPVQLLCVSSHPERLSFPPFPRVHRALHRRISNTSTVVRCTYPPKADDANSFLGSGEILQCSK